jgi:predicted SnoaL-like aldol condensation-catalyzing enzyme
MIMGQVEDNVGLVHTALRVVFSEGQVDQIDTYFADDFVQHSPYTPPGGREELRQWWSGMLHAIPDVTTTVTGTVGGASEVATFRIVSGTIRNDMPDFGIKAAGQPIEFRVADNFTIRDHEIVSHWEVADTGPLVALALASPAP